MFTPKVMQSFVYRFLTGRFQRRCLCSSQPIASDTKLRRYLGKLTDELSALEKQAATEMPKQKDVLRMRDISPTVRLNYSLYAVENDLSDLGTMLEGESDKEMKELLREEQMQLNQNKVNILESIIATLLPEDADDIHEVMLEVHAGVGGTEASAFAREMFELYRGFCYHRGWMMSNIELVHHNNQGGDRNDPVSNVKAQISGDNVYRLLKYESGVHRVQRVPSTEKSGRVHTSTAVVVVLPKPSNIEINISPKDLKLDVYRSQGGGGQSVNTSNSAVRLTHLPTGITVECQETRSQLQNRERALKYLQSRLYEKQLTAQQADTSSMRKLQIGGANRNEKIRTYNMQQDRITDHRVKVTVNSIREVMEGGEAFESFISDLIDIDRRYQLTRLLDDMDKEK